MHYRLVAGTINWYRAEKGWTNVHLDVTDRGIWNSELKMATMPDFIADIAETTFHDEMFHEVRLHHVLEHMSRDRGMMALREIHRILKPEGALDIEVPDMNRIANAWVAGDHAEEDLQQWIYGEDIGGHGNAADFHRYGWSERALREAVAEVGFTVVGNPATGLAVRLICEKA